MPKQKGGQGRGQSRGQFQGQRSQAQGQPADLKSREYRDEKGQIHHHTNTYMDQHKGDRDRER